MGFYERIGVFVGMPEGCVMFVRPIFAVSFFAVGVGGFVVDSQADLDETSLIAACRGAHKL